MDLSNIMKQAKELQDKMKQLQDELAEERVDFSSGGGVIEAVVNGKHELLELKISKEVINSEEPEFLEDLILSAVNGAMRKADDRIQNKLSTMTGGLDLPFPV